MYWYINIDKTVSLKYRIIFIAISINIYKYVFFMLIFYLYKINTYSTKKYINIAIE